MPTPSLAPTDATRAYDVLVLCARSRPAPDDVARIRALVERGVDWAALWEQAVYHRIHLLLQHGLDAAGVKPPPPLRDVLKRHARLAAYRTAFLKQELRQLLAEAHGRDVRLIPFKGPVLAEIAYASPALRTFSDLDLLIRPGDLGALRALLLERGYTDSTPYYARTQLDRHVQRWLNQQVQFMKGAATFNLDVHLGLVPPLYTYPTTFDELWARSVPLAGYPHGRCFSPEDLLIVLSFQGIKDRWERLKNVCDVAELLEGVPAIDWDRVRELATYNKARRLLALALDLAHRLLGAPVPAPVLETVRANLPVQALSARLRARLPVQYNRPVPGLGERLRLHLAVQEDAAAKLRYCTFSALRNTYDLVAPLESAIEVGVPTSAPPAESMRQKRIPAEHPA